MKTPALKKDTVLYQILVFVAGLLTYIQGDVWFGATVGDGTMSLIAMASSIVAIGLSFTKPRVTKENLEVLEVTDWDEE